MVTSMTAGGLRVAPEDIATCRALLRRGSKSFSAASLLLPRRIRPAVAGMYAFCRVADDAVDLEGSGQGALEGLRRRLDRIYEGAPADDAVDRTFTAVIEAFEIPRVVPEALLEGFAWDVEERRYETLSEVRAYSARVASTVGVMMTLLMGRRQPEALARACDLGVAMQLTNIARDVGEDARQGRLYLPRSWLREAGVDPEAWLRQPRYEPAIGEVTGRLLDEADRLYQRADGGVVLLPRDCRAAIRAARLVYADIGRVIRQNDLDSVSRRAFTSRWRKLTLLVRALLGPSEPAAASTPALQEVAFLVGS